MKQTLTFKTGLEVPNLGFGTWQITRQECTESVKTALDLGYRHIDTADKYGNHKEVGEGIKQSGIDRKDIFLTTKVWRDFLHHDEVLDAASRFLEELQTDYLDLLLVHWPNTEVPITETLEALKELQEKGTIKSFGLSNFTIPLLQEALDTGMQFVTNQVEFHPSLYQKELKEFCDKNNIIITAYSPIAQGADLKLPIVQELAQKYGKTPSQIALNWILKKDIIVIPRSHKKEHIQDNLGALSFDLSQEDSAKIDSLNIHNRLICPPFALFED